MAYTPARLAGTTLGTGSATLFTASGGGAVVKQVLLANKTAAAATATVLLAGISIVNGMSIPPNSSITVDLVQVLNATETLTGLASAAGTIDILVSGVTF